MLKAVKKLHWSIYILALANGVIMAGFMMILPLLPAYSRELAFSEYQIGLVVAAFGIGRVLFQFPLGILSDYAGRKLILTASMLMFAVTTAAYALTDDATVMISLRLLQGLSASGFVVASQSFVNDLTPTENRGLANGINGSAINIGVIAGPVLGGVLSQAFSLQAPFWAGGALGAICFLFCLAMPSGARRSRELGETSSFLSIERLKHTFSPVLSRPAFSLSLIHFLLMGGLAIFITSAPILTAELLSWDADDIALALASGGAVAAVASPFLGRLSDRIGHLWLLWTGLLLMAAQCLAIYYHPGTFLTMLAFAAGGAAAPAYFNSFYSLIGDATTRKERGAVTGFIGSFGEWGGIAGSALIVPLTWRYVNVSAPMAVDAGLLLLCLILAVALKSPLKRRISSDRPAHG